MLCFLFEFLADSVAAGKHWECEQLQHHHLHGEAGQPGQVEGLGSLRVGGVQPGPGRPSSSPTQVRHHQEVLHPPPQHGGRRRVREQDLRQPRHLEAAHQAQTFKSVRGEETIPQERLAG